MDGWAMGRWMAGEMNRRKERCWLYEWLAGWRAGKMDNAWMDDEWVDEETDRRKEIGRAHV